MGPGDRAAAGAASAPHPIVPFVAGAESPRAEAHQLRDDESPLAGGALDVRGCSACERGDGECRTIPEPGGVT